MKLATNLNVFYNLYWSTYGIGLFNDLLKGFACVVLSCDVWIEHMQSLDSDEELIEYNRFFIINKHCMSPTSIHNPLIQQHEQCFSKDH